MFRRRHPDLDDPRLAPFADDVRRAHTETPDERVAARHLAAMRDAAAAPAPSSAGAAPRPVRRRSPLRPVLAGGLALLGLMVGTTGLAAAGVALPDPVQAPFDVVGITLPNQDDDETPARTAPADAPRPATTPPATTPPASAPGQAEESDAARARRRQRQDDAQGRGSERRRQDPPREARSGADTPRRREDPPSAANRGKETGRGTPATPRRNPATRSTPRRNQGTAPRQRRRTPARTRRRPAKPAPRERAPAKPPAAQQQTPAESGPKGGRQNAPGSTVPETTTAPDG